MNLDFLIRLLWSGWFAFGVVWMLTAFVVAWRRKKLALGQVLVSLLLVPIFSVGTVTVWFRPSQPPNLIDGMLAMFVLAGVAGLIAKAWIRRKP
ncbi:MAG TPA: hypothetical protein VK815_15175 [Candidatus Acidoferrales bacterium]|jgi:hypothetical protein|nr:hypothetical protein [Candidatus Acidoferrales bacterium]